MKFLADQDVYRMTIEWLRTHGHDVITAAQEGLASAPDEELLKKAASMKRILVTRDKDFGALVFLRAMRETGVMFLKIKPATVHEVHEEILRLLEEHEESLKGFFCVVEPRRHRIRKLSAI